MWAAKPDSTRYVQYMVDSNKYGDPPITLNTTVVSNETPFRVGLYA